MPSALEIAAKYNKVIVAEAVEESLLIKSQEILQEQKDQLFRGEKSDGQPITPAYRPRTIAIKKRKGQPTDRVTLKDTGRFYSGTILDVRPNTIVIDSEDPKTKWLLEKYGEKIFGLNGVSRTILKPVLQSEIKQQIINQVQKA